MGKMSGDNLRKRRVYFIQIGLRGLIKVGCSCNATKRMADLQRAHFLQLTLLGVAKKGYDEYHVHRRLAQFRVAGEWYYPEDRVMALVRELCGTVHQPNKQNGSKARVAYAEARSNGLEMGRGGGRK